ncbi:hypothetical protein ACFL96_00170 [Thermoproteota archaeon]
MSLVNYIFNKLLASPNFNLAIETGKDPILSKKIAKKTTGLSFPNPSKHADDYGHPLYIGSNTLAFLRLLKLIYKYPCYPDKEKSYTNDVILEFIKQLNSHKGVPVKTFIKAIDSHLVWAAFEYLVQYNPHVVMPGSDGVFSEEDACSNISSDHEDGHSELSPDEEDGCSGLRDKSIGLVEGKSQQSPLNEAGKMGIKYGSEILFPCLMRDLAEDYSDVVFFNEKQAPFTVGLNFTQLWQEFHGHRNTYVFLKYMLSAYYFAYCGAIKAEKDQQGAVQEQVLGQDDDSYSGLLDTIPRKILFTLGRSLYNAVFSKSVDVHGEDEPSTLILDSDKEHIYACVWLIYEYPRLFSSRPPKVNRPRVSSVISQQGDLLELLALENGKKDDRDWLTLKSEPNISGLYDQSLIDETVDWMLLFMVHEKVGLFDTVCERAEFSKQQVQVAIAEVVIRLLSECGLSPDQFKQVNVIDAMRMLNTTQLTWLKLIFERAGDEVLRLTADHFHMIRQDQYVADLRHGFAFHFQLTEPYRQVLEARLKQISSSQHDHSADLPTDLPKDLESAKLHLSAFIPLNKTMIIPAGRANPFSIIYCGDRSGITHRYMFDVLRGCYSLGDLPVSMNAVYFTAVIQELEQVYNNLAESGRVLAGPRIYEFNNGFYNKRDTELQFCANLGKAALLFREGALYVCGVVEGSYEFRSVVCGQPLSLTEFLPNPMSDITGRSPKTFKIDEDLLLGYTGGEKGLETSWFVITPQQAQIISNGKVEYISTGFSMERYEDSSNMIIEINGQLFSWQAAAKCFKQVYPYLVEIPIEDELISEASRPSARLSAHHSPSMKQMRLLVNLNGKSYLFEKDCLVLDTEVSFDLLPKNYCLVQGILYRISHDSTETDKVGESSTVSGCDRKANRLIEIGIKDITRIGPFTSVAGTYVAYPEMYQNRKIGISPECLAQLRDNCVQDGLYLLDGDGVYQVENSEEASLKDSQTLSKKKIAEKPGIHWVDFNPVLLIHSDGNADEVAQEIRRDQHGAELFQDSVNRENIGDHQGSGLSRDSVQWLYLPVRSNGLIYFVRIKTSENPEFLGEACKFTGFYAEKKIEDKIKELNLDSLRAKVKEVRGLYKAFSIGCGQCVYHTNFHDKELTCLETESDAAELRRLLLNFLLKRPQLAYVIFDSN